MAYSKDLCAFQTSPIIHEVRPTTQICRETEGGSYGKKNFKVRHSHKTCFLDTITTSSFGLVDTCYFQPALISMNWVSLKCQNEKIPFWQVYKNIILLILVDSYQPISKGFPMTLKGSFHYGSEILEISFIQDLRVTGSSIHHQSDGPIDVIWKRILENPILSWIQLHIPHSNNAGVVQKCLQQIQFMHVDP